MFESFQSNPWVSLTLPPPAFFRLPGPQPMSLAPPLNEPSLAQPVQIPPGLYAQSLDFRVPVTIASVYAVTVLVVNRINKARGHKPWAVSKSTLFKQLVILHNVFLAVYSAWTCWGMWTALRNSIPRFNNEHGAAGIVDAFCRLAGPRGLGNAALYDSITDKWTMPNSEYSLGANGLPDPTDVGRLWNQGLAYYGWFFYLSKFYEVIDTAIILAKGKKSSTLQTYHHAGAMMCMWAGIRYMGQPIWIFVLVNSFIHAMMYTYYTVTALHIRVPNAVKRSLTTMQIMQFIGGTFMTVSYMFISYSIPLSASRSLSLEDLTKAMPAAVASAAESGIAAATASAGVVPWLKKLAFRAAGAEGIAENVLNAQGQHFGADAARYSQIKQEIINAAQFETVDCVDNNGQAFAILLNVMYLLPLTYLFARFFVRSYLRRIEPAADGQKPSNQMHQVEQAGLDALKGVSREIRRAAMEQNGDGDTSATDEEFTWGQDRMRPLTAIAEKKTSTAETIVDNNSTADNFEAVPPKHRAKRSEAEASASPVKPSNTFGVLKDDA
jgi:hypothetical protein